MDWPLLLGAVVHFLEHDQAFLDAAKNGDRWSAETPGELIDLLSHRAPAPAPAAPAEPAAPAVSAALVPQQADGGPGVPYYQAANQAATRRAPSDSELLLQAIQRLAAQVARENQATVTIDEGVAA